MHAFLTSAIDGGEWSVSRPGRFILGETIPGSYWIRGWVGCRVRSGRGCEKKKSPIVELLRGIEPRSSSL
jgi:hypothetical protein